LKATCWSSSNIFANFCLLFWTLTFSFLTGKFGTHLFSRHIIQSYPPWIWYRYTVTSVDRILTSSKWTASPVKNLTIYAVNVIIYLCHVNIRTMTYSDNSEKTPIRPVGAILLYFKIFFSWRVTRQQSEVSNLVVFMDSTHVYYIKAYCTRVYILY
jgi:hypothetical protein